MLRRTFVDVLIILLVAAAILVFIGQLMGQPILLAYVETGSMEPAMDAGDGFIAVPSAITAAPSEGDVITYEAKDIEGGGLTTHRVVEVTDEGYITKGDANPFTDQDGGEPVVTDEQVAAKALQVDGTVVTIPFMGAFFSTLQGALTGAVGFISGILGFAGAISPQTIGIGFIVLSIALLLSGIGSEESRSRERERTTSTEQYDTRIVAIILLILVLAPANAAMVLPDNQTKFTVDGEEVAEADGVSMGDEVTGEITAQNDGLLAILVVSRPAQEDVRLDRESVTVPAGGSTTTEATLPAPPPEGSRTVTVEEQRYLLLLPDSILLSLHERSPWLALGVLNLLIGAAVLGAVGGLLGFRQVRERDTSRPSHRWRSIKRWIRG